MSFVSHDTTPCATQFYRDQLSKCYKKELHILQDRVASQLGKAQKSNTTTSLTVPRMFAREPDSHGGVVCEATHSRISFSVAARRVEYAHLRKWPLVACTVFLLLRRYQSAPALESFQSTHFRKWPCVPALLHAVVGTQHRALCLFPGTEEQSLSSASELIGSASMMAFPVETSTKACRTAVSSPAASSFWL